MVTYSIDIGSMIACLFWLHHSPINVQWLNTKPIYSNKNILIQLIGCSFYDSIAKLLPFRSYIQRDVSDLILNVVDVFDANWYKYFVELTIENWLGRGVLKNLYTHG